ncbi:MAG: PBP1A family penicillin-binding protein [Candidatus Daviesbacteria bacterium]|nr:MAG: PBP1A family penicillin-binding protein [Candidatus Daviesbacteria bacterium]
MINKRDVKVALLTLTLLLIFIPIFTYIFFAHDLESKESLMNKKDTGVILLDRSNKPFFTFDEARYKAFISLSEIPLHLQQTVITTEDRDFYQHPGFSWRGMIRSAVTNIIQRNLSSGGSTITQQLVKNSLLAPSKNFLRKYQEIVLSQEIERRFSKKEILEMYLNSVYFGQGAFGVEEASQTYFNKSARDLNLSESALLAALLPAPSRLSQDQLALKARQEIVLQKMLTQKYISPQMHQYAMSEPVNLKLNEGSWKYRAPHFAFLVRDELIKRYGEETMIRSGFRVQTTLNSNWQEYAQQVVTSQVKNLTKNRVNNGAAAVIDPKTGQILTLVGSVNWSNPDFGQVDVTTSLRQPGSAFKPIVYVAGFEQNLITPATLLKDTPTTYNLPGSPPYKPVNFDRKFRGPVLARRALANSLNVPSVEVMSKVGVPTVLEMAKRLGITNLEEPAQYGLSLVLGAGEVKLLELTSVYGVFANDGIKIEPTTILEINDKLGRKIFSYQPTPQKVLEPEQAFLISSILSDANSRAEVFGNILNISRPAAVKTGTTEDFRDSLTLGYTPSLVVGAWVGNSDGTPMDQIAGSLGAAPIWKSLMENFLTETPVEKFSPPANISQVWICRQNGLLLKEASSSGLLEYFIKGSEPKKICVLPKLQKENLLQVVS